MSHNTQPPEKQVDDKLIDVIQVWPTIQGEGPFAGWRAIFVRFAGCDLQCSACDTDYTTGRAKKSVEEIASKVFLHHPRLVVITGGEPYRQTALVSLVNKLFSWDGDLQIQIETNGTYYLPGLLGRPGITIVCSPKTPKLHKHFVPNCYKYVLQHGKVDPNDGLPTVTLGNMNHPARPEPGIPVYVQPLDECDKARNQLNLQAAVESVQKFGYILSIQSHKLAGLP